MYKQIHRTKCRGFKCKVIQQAIELKMSSLLANGSINFQVSLLLLLYRFSTFGHISLVYYDFFF